MGWLVESPKHSFSDRVSDKTAPSGKHLLFYFGGLYYISIQYSKNTPHHAYHIRRIDSWRQGFLRKKHVMLKLTKPDGSSITSYHHWTRPKKDYSSD